MLYVNNPSDINTKQLEWILSYLVIVDYQRFSLLKSLWPCHSRWFPITYFIWICCCGPLFLDCLVCLLEIVTTPRLPWVDGLFGSSTSVIRGKWFQHLSVIFLFVNTNGLDKYEFYSKFTRTTLSYPPSGVNSNYLLLKSNINLLIFLHKSTVLI